jgi:hypothetical protein
MTVSYMLCIVHAEYFNCYPECHAECRLERCRYAELRCAECRGALKEQVSIICEIKGSSETLCSCKFLRIISYLNFYFKIFLILQLKRKLFLLEIIYWKKRKVFESWHFKNLFLNEEKLVPKISSFKWYLVIIFLLNLFSWELNFTLP